MYQLHEGSPESGSPDSLFRARCDWPFFRQNPMHEEALARLHFLVERQRRVGLLLGGPGAGKSVVLQVFGRELSRAGHSVALANVRGAGPSELTGQIAAGLGANPGVAEDVFHLWRLLTDRLAENRHQQRTTVILLDDADHAPGTVCSHIVRLAQHCPQGNARLTLLLAADGRRLANLGSRLLDLAALRIELGAGEKANTASRHLR